MVRRQCNEGFGAVWQKLLYLKPGLVMVAAALGMMASGASSAAALTPTDAPPGSVLQQDTNRIRDIGTVGVLAFTTDGATSARARAGVAELGANQPVSWDSHVRIGSNTKTLVATVMLQLEAEGKLSLNDTVERWLPGVIQGHGNHGEHITIRQLLQHTSGLFDFVLDDSFLPTIATADGFYQHRFTTYTPQQLISLAMGHAPNFAPGARWDYSNTNYIVAGEIIKAVTGESWDKQVQKRIITPLGLTETSEPGTQPNLPAPFMHGYELFGTDGVYSDTTLDNMTWGGAGGSLISTPENISRFFTALMKGQLLPAAQLAEMETTVPMSRNFQAFWPGAAYGLGLIRINLPCGGVYWSHSGDVIGYNNTNGVTPDGEHSAVAISSTDTLTDDVFADNSIAATNDLVWHALCGQSSQSRAADFGSTKGQTAADIKRQLML